MPLAVPKAAWASSPHGSAGLVCTSMSSATRTTASVRRPTRGSRESGSVPSRIDSPRRSSSTRPTSSVCSAQPRLAELPPETTDSVVPTADSTSVASRASSCMLDWSGTTPLWQARLVPMPASVRAGSLATRRPRATRPAGSTPSRRSPSSTMSTTACAVPWWEAARERASSTEESVFKLVDAWRTTASTWLIMGERISVRFASMPADSSLARLSMRESPSPLAPPRSIAAATPGEPSTALVTPVTRTPRGASRSTSVRVLVSMASRSTSRRGALIECSGRATSSAPGRHRGPCRPDGRGAGSGDRWRATRARARSRRSPSRSRRRRPCPRG